MQTAAQNAAYGQPGAANGDQADDALPKKRPRGRPLGSKTKVRPPVPSVFSLCFLNANGQLQKVSGEILLTGQYGQVSPIGTNPSDAALTSGAGCSLDLRTRWIQHRQQKRQHGGCWTQRSCPTRSTTMSWQTFSIQTPSIKSAYLPTAPLISVHIARLA